MTTFAQNHPGDKNSMSLAYSVLLHLTSEPQQDLRKSGKCFLRLLSKVCWFVPLSADMHTAPAFLTTLARALTFPVLSNTCQSFQAGKNGADNILWPLCKIKSLFLYKRKYCPSFQSCNFNNLFKDGELCWRKPRGGKGSMPK